MFLQKILLVLAVSLLPLSTAIAESTVKDGKPRYVETTLVPEFDAITAGEPLSIAIVQKHTEGWHTYWKNPGDSGETTTLQWTLPKGFTANPIVYPAPERQATGPLMNFGFSGEAVLLTSLETPDKIKGNEVTLHAKVSWLVCKDICIPEQKDVTLTLPVAKEGKSPNAINPALFSAARASIPQTASWQGTLEEQEQSITLTFTPDRDMAEVSDIFFFPEEWGIILNAEPQNNRVDDNILSITMARDTRPLSDIQNLNGVLTYKDADGKRQSVALSLPVTPTLTLPHQGGGNSKPSPLAGEGLDGGNTSFIQAIFLAILGGLILNLMPCVFPVLSIKALSLVKMSEKEQRHANIHGLLYTAGILVCFGLIAGLLIALKAGGKHIGWGFQLQNPVVVLLLAYLLFVMALNLSGFFEIRSGVLGNIGHKLASHHGYKGSFFTGMLATIVATPCTAPFMATAMGYALTQPPVVALLVFMALGLGLALPYLLLCFIPSLRKSLPKPGAWMETFRQFLSFPLFLSVAWLIWVYGQQVTGHYGTLIGLCGLVLIAFAIWVGRHEPHRQPMKTAVHALSIGALIVSLLIAGFSASRPASEMDQSPKTSSVDHVPYTPAALDSLLAGNEAIFVDMTADWCITCKVNEKVALFTDKTQNLFQENNITLVVGDWTNRNPDITHYLNSYGRDGVPLYVYYGPRDVKTGQRPEPKILPQLLTPGLIADVIKGEE